MKPTFFDHLSGYCPCSFQIILYMGSVLLQDLHTSCRKGSFLRQNTGFRRIGSFTNGKLSYNGHVAKMFEVEKDLESCK